MAFIFRTELMKLLPHFYKERDTNKDTNGQGTLERYLESFGMEIDEELIPQIENFVDIIDPTGADSSFLSHIAYTLGRPPDFFDDEAEYRKLLLTVATIYKWRGTIKSYEAMFGLFGLSIHITEHFPEDVFYDMGYTYDADYTWDQVCQSCVPYDIGYWSLGDDCTVPEFTEVDSSILDAVAEIIAWLEPLDATLALMVKTLKVCEGADIAVTEAATGTLYTPDVYYDNNPSDTYDAALTYDSFTTTPTVLV